MARRGRVRNGTAWQYRAGEQVARCFDGAGPGKASSGWVRRGGAWRGEVRFGMVSIGRANRFVGVFGAWRGSAGHVAAGQGTVYPPSV
jgi:hypothetical protein